MSGIIIGTQEKRARMLNFVYNNAQLPDSMGHVSRLEATDIIKG